MLLEILSGLVLSVWSYPSAWGGVNQPLKKRKKIGQVPLKITQQKLTRQSNVFSIFSRKQRLLSPEKNLYRSVVQFYYFVNHSIINL